MASKGTDGYNSLIVTCAIGVMIRVLSKDNVRTSVLYVISINYTRGLEMEGEQLIEDFIRPKIAAI